MSIHLPISLVLEQSQSRLSVILIHYVEGVSNLKIFENIINHKINTISGEELLRYAKQFNISVTEQETNKVAEYLRSTKVNIFNNKDRTRLIKEIAKISGSKTAREVNQLFLLFTNKE